MSGFTFSWSKEQKKKNARSSGFNVFNKPYRLSQVHDMTSSFMLGISLLTDLAICKHSLPLLLATTTPPMVKGGS